MTANPAPKLAEWKEELLMAIVRQLLRHPEVCRPLADHHHLALPFALVMDEELDEIEASRTGRRCDAI